MEDDPTFDCGKGSFLNLLGEVEMDASLMDGRNLSCGSVACIQNVLHPIEVARLVMRRTQHVMLVGQGALQFAKSMGIEEVDPEELVTDREREFLSRIRNDPAFKSRTVFENSARIPGFDHKLGTVGCVAMDLGGNIAAGTSTGGTPKKLAGRSGDSPIIGAGTFADNESGGCSATGWGESIIKVLLTKSACDFIEQQQQQPREPQASNSGGSCAQCAVEAAIRRLVKKVPDGLAGLVMIDRDGNYGLAYNTDKMAFAYASDFQVSPCPKCRHELVRDELRLRILQENGFAITSGVIGKIKTRCYTD